MSNKLTVPIMFLTCTVEIDRQKADNVISQMESQGFKSHNKNGDVHFTYNDKVNIYTSLYIPEDESGQCYLIFRPHVN